MDVKENKEVKNNDSENVAEDSDNAAREAAAKRRAEKESIFTKESLEKVTSPDELNNILRVTKPGVWVFLLAVIALLVGALVFSFVGTIEVKYSSCVASSEDDPTMYLFVKEENISKIQLGQEIRAEGQSYIISLGDIPSEAVQVDKETFNYSPYVMKLADINYGDWVYLISTDFELENHVAAATIVTEKLSPITLLFA